MHPRPATLRHRVGGGAFAGLVAGAVLELILVAMTVAMGQGPWLAMKAAAIPLLGDIARTPDFHAGAVALGLAMHGLIAMAFGVVFGLAVAGWSARGTVVLGALFGVAAWFTMYWLVMPLVGLAETAHATPAAPTILMHVAFGLLLGVGYLPFQHETLERHWTRRALRLAHVPGAVTPSRKAPAVRPTAERSAARS